MNYRHAYHAGNFADVFKHLVFVSAILHLRRKEKSFCVIDAFGGAGLYDLEGSAARRTGEAEEGVSRLRAIGTAAGLPEPLSTYLESVAQEGGRHYPGAPRLAARLIRPQDRLIAIEKHAEEAAALRGALAPFGNARAVEGDGYERLPLLLPPHERRGIVLIDPPYEAEDEFERATDLLARAHRRFATGVYLLWYPVKSRAAADALAGEVRARGLGGALRLEIDIGRDVAKDRLSAAGLLVVNPTFGLENEMENCAAIIAPRLGRTEVPAAVTLTRL